MKFSGMVRITLMVLVLALVATPIFGFTAGRPTGLRVTVDSIDATTFTADLSVTMTTTGTSPIGTIGSPVGFLGNRWSFQYTFFGTTVTNRYVWINPSAPAIDFGDGSSVPSTTLTMVTPGPPNVYTGSFMHTYPGEGNYDLRVGACRIIGPTSAVTPPAAGYGNLATVGTATTVNFLLYYLPTFTSPNYISANFVSPFVIGITNGVGQTAGGGFGGITIAGPAVTDIPTANEVGLLLLALMLAAGGVVLMRR